MSRIVFLSRFFGNMSANAICAENIAKELKKMGHKVDIISYEESPEKAEGKGIYIITKPAVSEKSILGRAGSIASIVLGSMSSAVDKDLTALYYDKLCQIHNVEPVDVVVAMHFPFESIQALAQFKIKYPKVKTVIYELDSAVDGIKLSKMPLFFNRAAEKWLSQKYAICDTVVIMKSHEAYWKSKFAKKFGDKLRLADIPVLTEKIQHKREEKAQVTMLYSGLLEKKYRSPSYMLAVLKELKKGLEFEISFYSKGDCEEEIKEAAKEIKGIRQCGYVSVAELERATESADILVNIGNAVSKSVPSKMITYMSYGKPIIHFSSQEDDICRKYMERYPLSLILDGSEQSETACGKIADFIEKTKGKRAEFDKIREMFAQSDPKYSANIICEK